MIVLCVKCDKMDSTTCGKPSPRRLCISHCISATGKTCNLASQLFLDLGRTIWPSSAFDVYFLRLGSPSHLIGLVLPPSPLPIFAFVSATRCLFLHVWGRETFNISKRRIRWRMEINRESGSTPPFNT